MNEYRLETSSDKKKWTLRGKWREGDPSRFGPPMSPDILMLEARHFIDSWVPQNRSYDDEVRKAIGERKYVRVIIEL